MRFDFRAGLLAVGALMALAMQGPVAAQATTTPILQVCMPLNNDADLSSNGCACIGNNDCIGVCSVPGNVCVGGPDVPVCAILGNGLDLSANGCPCMGNNDCSGVCLVSTSLCAGGPGPATAPPRCQPPGSGGDLSPDGCPCNVNGDCVGTCSTFTRTCGALVGAIANTPTTITGLASADVFLGAAITDSATVAGGLVVPSRVQFTLHGPTDPACAGSVATSSVMIAGNGTVVSPPFVPSAVGTFTYIAAYQGNAWNLPSRTACDNAAQRVVVTDTLFRNGFE